ncbi:serine/threonine protein kinase [bacterium]|nr:MAG: serine/threonine protein kinase [bacterium]
MQCALCGHKNSGGAVNCASCGAPLSLTPSGNPHGGVRGVQTGHTGSGSAAAQPYSPHLPKGVRLQDGKYAVGEVLGQGGFGITYKGGDLALKRYVAIKEFFPQGCTRQNSTVAPGGSLSAADYAGVKAKFVEEARILGRFSDPGIVRVYGVFEENNTAYMVMEFLEGYTLSARITEKGTLDEAEVLDIAEKIGHALSVVHQSGLIHRDIKPDNICITKDGRVVLIDFGTARNFASNQTVKHTTMLTAGYAPLEQYGQQARFGPYTDIYALAATLYHALTGQLPPPAPDRMSGVELKAPNLLNPKVSLGLSQALVRALNVKAPDRPQNVEAFLAAIKPLGQRPSPQDGLSLGKPGHTTAPGWNGGNAVELSNTGSGSSGDYASIRLIGENQILTNASPQSVLVEVEKAFQTIGIPNPTVDGANYRVFGSKGHDPRTGIQNLLGQVTQDSNGVLVTISSNPPIVNHALEKNDTRRLITIIQSSLKALPATLPALSSNPYPQSGYPAQGYPQQGYPQQAYPQQSYPPQNHPQPSYGSPTPYPQGRHYPPAPMVKLQGSNVLTLGILGLFCCAFCAPIAWITANSALQSYGDSDPGDRSTVEAGRVLGIIGTVLWGLAMSGGFLSSLGS